MNGYKPKIGISVVVNRAAKALQASDDIEQTEEKNIR